jgi:GGDEF domain-containing protein
MNGNPYQALVSLLSNILEAYTTAFYLFDPKTGQLNLMASQSLSRFVRDTTSLPLEQSGILSQVQKVGQTVHLDKLQETSLTLPATVPFYREGESHLKAIFAMPVADGAGVLYVDTKYGWGFSDKQQKWIREIAAVLHQLLKRQDCLEQQQGFAGILQFWYKVDDILLKELSVIDSCRRFVSECSQLLEIEYGFAALREVGQPHYHVLAGTPNIPQSLLEQQFLIKQGLAGWLFEQAKGLHIARMNPHTPEHFLFTPAEGLPHHGTLWGLPVPISLGHTLALLFLARTPQELNTDCQHAISCAAHAFALHLDRVSLQEECDHLQTHDLTTGILNSATFASRADALLATSMQTSSPFALALMQFEPWHTLHTAASPKQIADCQRELAWSLRAMAPSEAFLALISENRYGFIFPQMSFQEANPILTHLMDRGKQVLAAMFKGMRVRSYLGVVGYPQDGTRIEELWPLVYRRLYRGIHAQPGSAEP